MFDVDRGEVDGVLRVRALARLVSAGNRVRLERGTCTFAYTNLLGQRDLVERREDGIREGEESS